MVKVTGVHALQFAAAVAALTAAQFLTGPIGAARPMFPLSPACANFTYSGIMQIKLQNPDFQQNHDGPVTNPVMINFQDGKPTGANIDGFGAGGSSGPPSGGFFGRQAEFTVHWNTGRYAGQWTHFLADVTDNLRLLGSADDSMGNVALL